MRKCERCDKAEACVVCAHDDGKHPICLCVRCGTDYVREQEHLRQIMENIDKLQAKPVDSGWPRMAT